MLPTTPLFTSCTTTVTFLSSRPPVGVVVTTAASCPAGSLPVVALSMTINVDPDSRSERAYNLSDSIALRNAPRCT